MRLAKDVGKALVAECVDRSPSLRANAAVRQSWGSSHMEFRLRIDGREYQEPQDTDNRRMRAMLSAGGEEQLFVRRPMRFGERALFGTLFFDV